MDVYVPIPRQLGRKGKGSPRQRARHNRARRGCGQRVMRHFLAADPLLRRAAASALAVAPLALGMLVTAAPAVLVATPRKPHGSTPGPVAATPRTVDVAAVAARAENNLPVATRAVEKTAEVLHRGGR